MTSKSISGAHGPGVSEESTPWRGPGVRAVSASEFAGRFGHWAFQAQTAPVKVVNNKTGAVLGYFVPAKEYEEFLRVRDQLPKAVWAWELSPDLAAELEKPLTPYASDLDALAED